MTIAMALEDYMQEHGPEIANMTRLKIAKAHVLEYYGNDTIDAVTPQSIRAYTEVRRKAGLKDSSIKRELTVLRAALNHQVFEGRLENAPRFRMPKESPPKDRWLTPEEAGKLYRAMKAPHLKLFTDIALRTGQRKGAILDLTWDQVKLDERLIYFNPSGRKQTMKRRAIVPIAGGLYAILKAAHEIRRSDYVIESQIGPITGDILNGFGAARKRAGLGDDVTPHTLRHTVASWLAQRGMDFLEISRLLAHKIPSTTERYMHHNPNYLKKLVSVLDGICASFARMERNTAGFKRTKRNGV